MSFSKLSLALAALLLAGGTAWGNPVTISYQGQLLTPTGNPSTDDVDMVFQIYSPDGTCLLYEQVQPRANFATSQGQFTVQVGSALLSALRGPNDANLSMTQVFSNQPVQLRASGSTNCSAGYTPSAADVRKLRVIVTGPSGTPDTLSPDQVISSSAFALSAETLQGLAPTDLLKVKVDGTNSLSQANLESVFTNNNFPKLTNLLNGGASQFISSSPTAPVGFNNQRLINISSPTSAQDAATKIYSDSNVAGKVADATGVGAGIGNGKVMSWDAVANKWIATVIDGTTLSNLNAVKLQTRDIAVTAPSNGYVLTWNQSGNKWEPQAPAGGGGISALVGDVTASGVGAVTTTISNGAVTTAKISNDSITSQKINSTGIAVNRLLMTDATTGLNVTYMSCSIGEVLQWTASGWVCTPVAALLGPSGVVAGAQGSATQVAQVTVDAQGRVTSLTNVNIAFPVTSIVGRTGAVTLNLADIGGAGTAATKDFGTAAGNLVELSGTSQLPALNGSLLTSVNAAKLQARAVSTVVPTPGQVLTWNGSAWEGATPSAAGYQNGGNSFGANSTIGLNDAFSLGFKSNNVTRMMIDAGGNVGIGTLSPVTPLDVVGNAAAGSTDLRTFNSNSTGTARMVVGASTIGGAGALSLEAHSPSSTWATGQNGAGDARAQGGATIWWSGTTGGPLSMASATGLRFYSGVGVSNPVASFERMRIDNSGNVGIGTTAPAALLDINGTMRVNTICDNTGANCKVVSSGWAGGGSVTSVVAGVGLVSGSITTQGTLKVDVGTNANQILQLNGSAQVPAVNGSLLTNVNAEKIASRSVSLTTPSAGQVLGWNSSISMWEPVTMGGGGSVTQVTAGPGLLGGIISTTGSLSVDIGTTANKIVQLTSAGKLPAVDGSLLTNISNNFPLLSSLGGSPAAPAYSFGGDSDTGIYSPGANTLALSTGGTTRMLLDGGGNVGIGTTAPAARLHIFDNSGNNLLLESSTSLASSAMNLSTSTRAYSVGVGGSGVSNGTADKFYIYDLFAGQPRVAIDPSGNVGIGTTFPSAKLDVSGSVNLGTGNGSGMVALGGPAATPLKQVSSASGVSFGLPPSLSASTGAYGTYSPSLGALNFGDTVMCSPENSPPQGLIWSCAYNGSSIVLNVFCGNASLCSGMSGLTWRVAVIKW